MAAVDMVSPEIPRPISPRGLSPRSRSPRNGDSQMSTNSQRHLDLYEKGNQKALKREQKQQHERMRKEQEELDQCSFKPELITSGRTDVDEGDVYQRLYIRGQERAVKNAGVVSNERSKKEGVPVYGENLLGGAEPEVGDKPKLPPKNKAYANVASRVYSPREKKDAPLDMEDAHPPLRPQLHQTKDKYQYVESRVHSPATPKELKKEEYSHKPATNNTKKYAHVETKATAAGLSYKPRSPDADVPMASPTLRQSKKYEHVGSKALTLAGADPPPGGTSPRSPRGGKSPRSQSPRKAAEESPKEVGYESAEAAYATADEH